MRCDTCSDVLWSRHAWDMATCSCGALTVSGRPRHPQIRWVGRPGGGWTELDPAPDTDPVRDTDQPPSDASPARTLGFAPSRRRHPLTDVARTR